MIGEPQELQLSETMKVTVATLDGFEQDLADGILADIVGNYTSETFPMTKVALLQTKVYAGCSLRAINGDPVDPLKSLLSYAGVVKRLNMVQRDALTKWASGVYAPAVEVVKKDESDQP